MKKVIDSSALRSEILRTFLSASSGNIAVLPEQLAMEAFKGDGKTNIRHSLKILSEFPDQIAVLKPTHAIVKLRPRKSGLHGRFVSDQQTAGFVKYCRVLFTDSWSEERARLDRERKQSLANRRYDRLKLGVGMIRQTIQGLKKNYSEIELKALRKRTILPGNFWERFCDDIFNSTIVFSRETPHVFVPTGSEIVYSYAFRYTLCAYGRAVDWIAEGGYATAPDSKIVNDYTDMAYAAYATFFDGLLTEDKKLDEIYIFAAGMMRRVFLKAADQAEERDSETE